MRDLFISHVEEDYDLVVTLAGELEAAGYSTWYYERDSAAGPSYLLQTREAIMSAQAVLLVISKDALSSNQVTKEIVRAHEGDKPIVPLLHGISDSEYKRRQPEWEAAIGAATSLPIPSGGLEPFLPRLLSGLDRLGVRAGPTPIRPNPPPVSGAQVAPSSIAGPTSTPAHEGSPLPPVGPSAAVSTRLLVAAGIGLIGFFTGAASFLGALSPPLGTPEAATYVLFPAVRAANLFANGLNAPLSAVIALGCYLAYRGNPSGFRVVRAAAIGVTAIVVLWILWVLFAGLGAPAWSQLQPYERSGFLRGTMLAGLPALLMFGLVVLMFHRGE